MMFVPLAGGSVVMRQPSFSGILQPSCPRCPIALALFQTRAASVF
jgi:hypothetical protein